MADFTPEQLEQYKPTEQLNPRTFAGVARQMITPWQTAIRPTWTIAGVRAALLALRNGEFSSAAQLFDSMLEDDEFPGDLQKRVNALLRSEFALVPKDDADRKLNRREQAAADAFPEMVPDGELFDLIASWLVLGVGIGTIDWYVDGPLWVPKLRCLPAEFLRYNEFERRWYYTAREGDQVVTPGDGKWILLAAGQRPWNWGLIRGLAVLWLSKGLTYGDWQRYCQKHGLPIIKAKIPIFRDDAEKDRFIDDLASIQQEGVVGLPTGPDGDGYDVELLEATDQSWESFQANLDRADRKIQIMLLGSNIGTEQTEATGGSRAAAETSSNGIDQDKAKADEKYVSQCLLEQFLRPFFAFNFGPSVEVPEPHWDVCPEEDARAWADAQTAFVGMLNAVRTTGFKIKNIVQLGQEYGLQLEEDPDAPPPAGTEEAAEIAAKAKPPTPPARKLDQEQAEAEALGFEVLDALPDGDGWLLLNDGQVDCLARAAAKAKGKGGERNIQIGPRGGRFYIHPSSGKKVYIRKTAPAGTKDKKDAPAGKKKAKKKKDAPKKDEPAPKTKKAPATTKKKEPKPGSGTQFANGDAKTQKQIREHLTKIGADRLAAKVGQSIQIEFDTPALKTYAAGGLYWSKTHKIDIKRTDDIHTSDAGKTVRAKGLARQTQVATHEFGHAVHMHGEQAAFGSKARADFEKADRLVERGYANGSDVSHYGRTNRQEYFAESFSAYHHRRDLLDSHSLEMVEGVLKLRGII